MSDPSSQSAPPRSLKPRLAVVVPCYNYGAFLREAVDSVMAGHHSDVELVIVDDGSTDLHTQQEVSRLAHEGFHVIRQENRGLAAARNAGIRAVTADYILPLDADNKIRPVFIERALAILDAHPAVGVVYGDAQNFGARDDRWVTGPFDRARLMQWNYIDACAVLRRTVWEQHGGYDGMMPVQGLEDWDLWLGTTGRGWEFAYVPEIVFDYRVKAESMIVTARKSTRSVEEFIARKHAMLYRDAWLQSEAQHRSFKESARRLPRLFSARVRARLFGSTRSGAQP
jgi:glycosyltransferase involved in cell wall biosynthesis